MTTVTSVSPQVIAEIQKLQNSLDTLVAEHREEEFMMEKSIEVITL